MNRVHALVLLALAVAAWVAAPAAVLAVQPPLPPAPPKPAVTNALPITSATRRLEEDELRDLLTVALNQRGGMADAELELRLTRPWVPVTVPAGPLAVEVLEPAAGHLNSTCILRFELHAGREVLGTWQAPVHLRLWREVLVARTALPRGQALGDADLARERRDTLTLRDPLCELPSDPGAFMLGESVPAGGTLPARALRLRPVVFRGQTAEAIVHDGAMMISLKVEVLEEGAPGQVVRIRNPQSRRELRGKVQNEQTIFVSL